MELIHNVLNRLVREIVGNSVFLIPQHWLRIYRRFIFKVVAEAKAFRSCLPSWQTTLQHWPVSSHMVQNKSLTHASKCISGPCYLTQQRHGRLGEKSAVPAETW